MPTAGSLCRSLLLVGGWSRELWIGEGKRSNKKHPDTADTQCMVLYTWNLKHPELKWLVNLRFQIVTWDMVV